MELTCVLLLPLLYCIYLTDEIFLFVFREFSQNFHTDLRHPCFYLFFCNIQPFCTLYYNSLRMPPL